MSSSIIDHSYTLFDVLYIFVTGNPHFTRVRAYIWDERALIGGNILFTGKSGKGTYTLRGSLQYIA